MKNKLSLRIDLIWDDLDFITNSEFLEILKHELKDFLTSDFMNPDLEDDERMQVITIEEIEE